MAMRFTPPRGFANPHLQTLYGSLFAPRPEVAYRRERWDTPDGDFVDIDFVGPDLKIGRARAAVEVQREVVRREDLAERHRGGQVWHRGDVPVVSIEVIPSTTAARTLAKSPITGPVVARFFGPLTSWS